MAIKLVDGDELIGVDLTSGEDEVMLFSAEGKVVRFKESSVRAMGCNTTGVRGIRLGEGDKVVSLIVPRGDGTILTATQNGYGKRTAVAEYPTKSRATKRISIKVTKHNGLVVGAVQVDDCDQIMMITIPVTGTYSRFGNQHRQGRNTQGVILIRSAEDKTLMVCNVLLNRLTRKIWIPSTAVPRKGTMKSLRKWTLTTSQKKNNFTSSCKRGTISLV